MYIYIYITFLQCSLAVNLYKNITNETPTSNLSLPLIKSFCYLWVFFKTANPSVSLFSHLKSHLCGPSLLVLPAVYISNYINGQQETVSLGHRVENTTCSHYLPGPGASMQQPPLAYRHCQSLVLQKV